MSNYRLELSIKDELERDVVEVAQTVTQTFLRFVDKATPRDTGRAAGNWYVGINRPIRTTNDNRRSAESLAKGTAKIGSASEMEYPTFYVSNNLPYIVKLNEGSSTQAPAKFVDNAFNRAARAAD